MRRPIVAGNWKMNTTLQSARELATAVRDGVAEANEVDVLVCPPFPYIPAVREAVSGSRVRVGAQNVWWQPSGAYTGETSTEMLVDLGCDSVILGHSERRHVLGEGDELINQKVQAALGAELEVVLCVGELLAEREANETESVLDRQMAGGLAGVSEESLSQLVVAYEPVWAIGTGHTATPDQAESAHAHLRKWLETHYTSEAAAGMRILYGGSVKPDNAAALMAQPNVDGALVGGASLKGDLFLPIVAAAQQAV